MVKFVVPWLCFCFLWPLFAGFPFTNVAIAVAQRRNRLWIDPDSSHDERGTTDQLPDSIRGLHWIRLGVCGSPNVWCALFVELTFLSFFYANTTDCKPWRHSGCLLIHQSKYVLRWLCLRPANLHLHNIINNHKYNRRYSFTSLSPKPSTGERQVPRGDCEQQWTTSWSEVIICGCSVPPVP